MANVLIVEVPNIYNLRKDALHVLHVEIRNADNMDIFINKIDPDKFRATNNIWNLLGLNAPQNIGMVSDLINQKLFSSKDGRILLYSWQK